MIVWCSLLDEREVVLYCDLHGHSRHQNIFIYGCENRSDPQRRLQERVFPYMLSRNAPDMFSFKNCRFHVQKSKEGTGRVVIWNMGIQNSYTMEVGPSVFKSMFLFTVGHLLWVSMSVRPCFRTSIRQQAVFSDFNEICFDISEW